MAAEIHFTNVAYRTKNMLMVWISLLWISDLPDMLFYYLIGSIPSWLIYVKFAFMVIYTGICLIIKRFKLILPYSLIMLVFIGGVMMSCWVDNQTWWRNWLPNVETTFFWDFVKIYIQDILLVLLVIAAIWLIKRKGEGKFSRVVISKPPLR